jgi:Lar family restriction alleviation protein
MNEFMNEELKPCPFCGSQAVLKVDSFPFCKTNYCVECCLCGCIAGYGNEYKWVAKDKAIERWNQRA